MSQPNLPTGMPPQQLSPQQYPPEMPMPKKVRFARTKKYTARDLMVVGALATLAALLLGIVALLVEVQKWM